MKWFLSTWIAVAAVSPAWAQSEEESLRDSRQYQIYEELDSLARWCNDVVRVLDNAERKAIGLQQRGRYSEAVRALEDGLTRANSGGREVSGLMTKKALVRGLRNFETLRSKIGNNERGLRTILFYGAGYLDLIRNVANNLDIPYVIPWERSCGRKCVPDYTEAFEEAYVEFIGESLKTTTGALVGERGGRFIPIGSSRAVLTILKAGAQDAATDLNDSLWRYGYSCTVQELREIAQDIDPDDADDVFQLGSYWPPLRDIADELTTTGRCYEGRNPRYGGDRNHERESDDYRDRDSNRSRFDDRRNNGERRRNGGD